MHIPEINLVPWRRSLAALRALWMVWAAVLGLAAAPAQAGPLQAVSYTGSGNALLFDPASGSGGWVGAIDEVADPAIVQPLSLVSVVLFDYDALARTLSGSFEFTQAADLGSSLFGTLSGSTTDFDPFGSGGQFELDYLITGGTGVFAGAGGYGLAFLTLNPAAVPDNYSEFGLLVFAVPEPGTLMLALMLLWALVPMPRRPSSPPKSQPSTAAAGS